MLNIDDRIAIITQAKLFRGFGDPSRLSILETLMDQPRSVSEIVEATGLSQPNVSGHLSCLRDCGLVSTQPRGRFTYYQLSDPRVKMIIETAASLIADVARGVYECTRYTGSEEHSTG